VLIACCYNFFFNCFLKFHLIERLFGIVIVPGIEELILAIARTRAGLAIHACEEKIGSVLDKLGFLVLHALLSRLFGNKKRSQVGSEPCL
jgi:hypothetical protein